MAQPKGNPIGPAAIAAVIFIVIAIGGSIFTSYQMNKTADTHSMSAGRTGDARPNLPSDQDPARGSRAANMPHKQE